MGTPTPARRPVDDTVADLGSLVDMGIVEEPPIPAETPPPVPPTEPPTEPADEPAE